MKKSYCEDYCHKDELEKELEQLKKKHVALLYELISLQDIGKKAITKKQDADSHTTEQS
jgi:hypothetical protein